MIIEIDDSIFDNCHNLNADERFALRDIAISRRSGVNFVLCSKVKLAKIFDCLYLDEDVKDVFKKIYSDQTRWHNFLKGFNFRIKLVLEGTSISKKKLGNVNILCVPLKLFSLYNLNMPPILIAEDYTDLEFYDLITRSYLKNVGVSSVNFSYFSLPGGGRNTFRTVKNTYENRTAISYCILDSDIEYPSGPIGETARLVEEVNQGINDNYSRYRIIKGREVENIIPMSILFSIIKNKDPLNKLAQLISPDNNGERAIFFADFKKGLKRHVITSKCNMTKSFWQNALKGTDFLVDCNQVKATNCSSFKNCNCQLIHGLGTDLLSGVVKHLKSKPFDFTSIDDYLIEEWQLLCQDLSAYMFAPSRIAS
ncbi:hypothetical protein NTH37_003895 [Vibrio fluvialis]|nr:hypothetical protein [Vibrio fluvialis]